MDGNTPERRFETWIALVFCLVLAGLAYGPGLSGDFLNYDDPRTVLENPAFAGGSVDLGLILDPTQRLADVYLPVNYLSLGLDVLLFGTGSALPFHLHALLLQALAGFVLVLLLRDLGASRSLALLGACPLLAHPALAESVLWVSSRKETLVALFGLLALWTGRRAIAGRAALWLPALMALLACYSKGSGIALPLMALPLWLLLPAAGGATFALRHRVRHGHARLRGRGSSSLLAGEQRRDDGLQRGVRRCAGELCPRLEHDALAERPRDSSSARRVPRTRQ
jgi:hypothetical protein